MSFFILQASFNIFRDVKIYTGAYVYVSYHSECLELVDCRQPGADSVDSASWTALWEQRILGQQVKEGMTREHLQRSEYTM